MSAIPFNDVPVFIPGYPHHIAGQIALLTTPERVGALPEYTGQGVTIAFIDSGFYRHPDLKGRIVAHVDATTDAIVVTDGDHIPKSEAYSWHGQMTTVIACGDGSKSGGRYRGIASGANLLLIKVSNPRNQVKEDDILRGLRWLHKHHRQYQVRVVNLSVGGDYVSFDPYHPLHTIVHDLADAGVVVVAAAGNKPLEHLLPPASAAHAITVGGIDDHNTLDRDRWRLYHHTCGMAYDGSLKPDLLAPAQWVAAPILPGTQVALEAFWLGAMLYNDDTHPVRQLIYQGRANTGLERLFGDVWLKRLHDGLQQRIYDYKLVDAFHQHVDGTSVAAPIVSAVVAQMLEVNPALTVDQVRHVLRSTAQPLADTPVEYQGAGVLCAGDAVRRLL